MDQQDRSSRACGEVVSDNMGMYGELHSSLEAHLERCQNNIKRPCKEAIQRHPNRYGMWWYYIWYFDGLLFGIAWTTVIQLSLCLVIIFGQVGQLSDSCAFDCKQLVSKVAIKSFKFTPATWHKSEEHKVKTSQRSLAMCSMMAAFPAANAFSICTGCWLWGVQIPRFAFWHLLTCLSNLFNERTLQVAGQTSTSSTISRELTSAYKALAQLRSFRSQSGYGRDILR